MQTLLPLIEPGQMQTVPFFQTLAIQSIELGQRVTTNRGIIQVYLLKKRRTLLLSGCLLLLLPNHAEKDCLFPYPASGGDEHEGSNSCPEEESHELRRADRNLWIESGDLYAQSLTSPSLLNRLI